MIGLEIRINDEDPITVASDNLVFVTYYMDILPIALW